MSIVEVYNLEEDIDLQIKDRGIKQKNFNLSEILEKRYFFSSNLALLVKSSKLNDKDFEALFTLGKYFENGYGLKQDYGKAMYFYHLAAKKGDPDAESNIGSLYYNGYGVCQDFALARKWFMKAARKLNLNALNNLGYIYDNGIGVKVNYKQNLKKATTWRRRAKINGFSN